MRRTVGRRATIAGLATTGALVAAVVVLGILGTRYVAFDGWPGAESGGGDRSAVTSPSAAGADGRAASAESAADAAEARAASAPPRDRSSTGRSAPGRRSPSGASQPRARTPVTPTPGGEGSPPSAGSSDPSGATAAAEQIGDETVLAEAVVVGTDLLAGRLAQVADDASDDAGDVSPDLATPVADTGAEAADETRRAGRALGAALRGVSSTTTLP